MYTCQTIPCVQFSYDLFTPNHTLVWLWFTYATRGNVNIGHGLAVTLVSICDLRKTLIDLKLRLVYEVQRLQILKFSLCFQADTPNCLEVAHLFISTSCFSHYKNRVIGSDQGLVWKCESQFESGHRLRLLQRLKCTNSREYYVYMFIISFIVTWINYWIKYFITFILSANVL